MRTTENKNITNNTSNTPLKKFRAGAISATIWQNQGKGGNGEAISYRTVSFQRSYKDRDGVWKNSNSLRINDLPKASIILQKAYEYVVMSGTIEQANDSQMIEEVI